MAAKPKGYKLPWTTTQAQAWTTVCTLLREMEPLHHIDPGRPLEIYSAFLVNTDHHNLTFLRKSTTLKHQRWLLALQEFDFAIHHIAGEINPADYPSRV